MRRSAFDAACIDRYGMVERPMTVAETGRGDDRRNDVAAGAGDRVDHRKTLCQPRRDRGGERAAGAMGMGGVDTAGLGPHESGRTACRGRGCQYVEMLVGAVDVKIKKKTIKQKNT